MKIAHKRGVGRYSVHRVWAAIDILKDAAVGQGRKYECFIEGLAKRFCFVKLFQDDNGRKKYETKS